MNKEDIEKIDLSKLAGKITCGEARGFFTGQKEHYKLLAYISELYNGVEISDIGTYKGCSALALSYNQNNAVFSYDVSDMVKIYNPPYNIEFRVIKEEYHKDILKSKIICLDTIHDGIHEKKVIDFLTKSKWKGLLILDDIHHFPEQNKLWESITLKKEDLTEIGHWSGTGLIYFE